MGTPLFIIPEAVNPPIPGESHRYYGNIHLKQLRLPSNNALRGTTELSSYPRYSADGSMEGDLDIHAAAAAGNFTRVKELLAPQGSGQTSSAFLLANEPSPSSGLTPLHYAASRGHLDIVKWLIDEAGAIVDLEDQTGETALLKASYNGHSSVVSLLLLRQANVALRDNDGWTALHNAASRGFLKIVKYFMEHTDANVDVKSNKGYTPLMNAASKGNIEIVEYLLNNCHANPFIKNKHGEVAYDVAAASQEIYICGLLEKAERDWWKGKNPLPEATTLKEHAELPNFDQPYDIYAFHVIVPIILYENQRSSSGFGGLSSLRGPPKYSRNNLLKNDRAPWSLPDGRPCSKSEVQLPLKHTSSSASVVSNTNSSKNEWGWVTEWAIDMTHPHVDSQGWQYARTFDENDRNWLPSPTSNNGNWVRRRRWVRVMKRQVDYTGSGGVLQLVPDSNSKRDATNYVEQAEAIIKKAQDRTASESELLGQYREALEILISGSKSDTNAARKQEATNLANSFMAIAEHLDNKIKETDTPPSPSFKDVPITPTQSKSSPPQPQFRYETPVNQSRSATPTITNLNAPSTTSIRSYETFDSPWNNTVHSNDTASNPSVVGDSTIVSPTRPQTGLSVTTVQANNITPYKWENDEDVHECRRCNRKFGIWIRRHHCRRCGQVVCDKCSTGRVTLPPNQVLNPSQNSETSQSTNHRVCDSCYKSMGLTPRQRSSSFTPATVISGGSSSIDHRRRLSSNSIMNECPACSESLINLNPAEQQEHIRQCTDNPRNVSGYKYVGTKITG